MTSARRKRVLVVGCRFDEDRRGGARPWRTPQAMAPAFLAGAFNPATCEVRVHSEQFSGPLSDRQLLAWPDMLVLTGLQVDFARASDGVNTNDMTIPDTFPFLASPHDGRDRQHTNP